MRSSNPLRYRLRGPVLERFRAYERARRRVFGLVDRFRVPPDVLAARYGLDPADVAVAVTAAGAYQNARR